MRNRILRLAAVAAVVLAIPDVSSSAQEMKLPPQLGSRQASEVPDRLLRSRAELGLTAAQVADLTALSAELHNDEKILLALASSKPWIAAARRPLPQHAFDRALAVLTPAQRAPAVRVLSSTEQTFP